jgi:hypothetical protein
MAEQTHDTRNTNNKNPVWDYQFADFDIPDAAPAAVVKSMPVNGVIRQIHVTTSAHATVTYTHTIKDASGRTLYAKAAIASGATDTVTLTADTEVYVPDGSTVEVLVSADPNSVESVIVEYVGW